jgi:hypothetical protein
MRRGIAHEGNRILHFGGHRLALRNRTDALAALNTTPALTMSARAAHA